MQKFIVMAAAAKMPSSCKGRYGRLALVELTADYAEKGLRPKMISSRAKGVARIIAETNGLNMGTTDKCAFRVRQVQFEAEAARLNEGRN